MTFLEQRQKLTRSTWLRQQIIFIHSAKLFSILKKLTFSISSGHTTTGKSPRSYSFPYSLPSLWKSARQSRQTHHFDQATWQHPRESLRHVRGPSRIYDVRMAQFVLKIENLSHIIGARGFEDSPSLIMTPGLGPVCKTKRVLDRELIRGDGLKYAYKIRC